MGISKDEQAFIAALDAELTRVSVIFLDAVRDLCSAWSIILSGTEAQ